MTAAPPTATVRCAHCEAPVPRGLLVDGAAEQFCCDGCRTARAIITGCGLDRYYALREVAGSAGRPASARRNYTELDDPAFERLNVAEGPDGLRTADLFLENVHCAACLWLVERLPRVVPGVVESRLDLRRSMVRLAWNPGRCRLSDAARGLARLGYPPHPARAAAAREARRRSERRQLVRLGVAGACAGNVMLIALALYAGLFDGMDPAHAALFRWISMGLSLLAVAWPGSTFFRGAVAALRTRSMHLDLPIAIGLGAGALWGAVNTVRGTGEIYFDSLSVLVFALLLGRYVQQRQQRWSADAVELLFSLTPSSATVVEGPDDPGRTVAIESVARGDLVAVRAGESIPADGIVEHGASTIDRALLTGESIPVPVTIGDAVAAGAVNLSGPLCVRVEATGEETRIGRLMRLVEDAAQRKAPIVRLADRLAGWFAAAALLLAALTAALWWSRGPNAAIEHAVALLIVTCPCGLGLATPLAMTVAIGRAARRGILVKGGEVLERLAASDGAGRIYLDKTGTATEGRLGVVEVVGDAEALVVAAAAERGIEHPVAEALRRHDAGLEIGPDDLQVADQHALVGGGVSALVDHRRVVVGSPAFVGGAATVESRLAGAAGRLAAHGLTPVLVAVDGVARCAIGLGDAVRPDSAAAVARLERLGWSPALLSGDHPCVVEAVGSQLGLPRSACLGGRTPESKLDEVRQESLRRTTVMVGDGVNDAAALAAAGVGIAVHGGAEASLAAADVHLARPGLGPVVLLMEGARRTMRTVRLNLAVSLGYNVIAAALAMGGAISPLLAAIIMPLSSLSVVAISVRGGGFRRENPDMERPR